MGKIKKINFPPGLNITILWSLEENKFIYPPASVKLTDLNSWIYEQFLNNCVVPTLFLPESSYVYTHVYECQSEKCKYETCNYCIKMSLILKMAAERTYNQIKPIECMCFDCNNISYICSSYNIFNPYGAHKCKHCKEPRRTFSIFSCNHFYCNQCSKKTLLHDKDKSRIRKIFNL